MTHDEEILLLKQRVTQIEDLLHIIKFDFESVVKNHASICEKLETNNFLTIENRDDLSHIQDEYRNTFYNFSVAVDNIRKLIECQETVVRNYAKLTEEMLIKVNERVDGLLTQTYSKMRTVSSLTYINTGLIFVNGVLLWMINF